MNEATFVFLLGWRGVQEKLMDQKKPRPQYLQHLEWTDTAAFLTTTPDAVQQRPIVLVKPLLRTHGRGDGVPPPSAQPRRSQPTTGSRRDR